VEALFAELKNLIGLRRLRLRRLKFVREQFCLAAEPFEITSQHKENIVSNIARIWSICVACGLAKDVNIGEMSVFRARSMP
jgi:hypothetical protein